MFFKGSRYAAVGEAQITDRTGRTIRYKLVRIIPDAPAAVAHLVHEGERLDHLAHRYYRDAERFWRICDANRADWPPDLVAVVGRRLLIPPAQG